MPARLSPDQVNQYLDSKPGWMMLTTVGQDGFPHSVPLGYFRLGDTIYLGCRAGTQKLKNIARNPKVSLLVESGKQSSEIKAVMIQGEASIFAEPADVLRLSREAARLRGTPEEQWPAAPRPGAVYIGVSTRRVISWDYSRGD